MVPQCFKMCLPLSSKQFAKMVWSNGWKIHSGIRQSWKVNADQCWAHSRCSISSDCTYFYLQCPPIQPGLFTSFPTFLLYLKLYKSGRKLEPMFLFLLDFSFANLLQWRDQEPPRASWDKGRALPVTWKPAAGGTASQARQERLWGELPQQSRARICSAPTTLLSLWAYVVASPARTWAPRWQPSRSRQLCIPRTQQHPKMYLPGHCHWKASGPFLEGRLAFLHSSI